MTSAKAIENNSFLNTDYRRAAVGLFVDGIDEFPDRYFFATKIDYFYINIIKFFEEQGFVKYIDDFKSYWADSRNRNKIMGEYRFDIGKKISQGRLFRSLPIMLSRACTSAFNRMIKA